MKLNFLITSLTYAPVSILIILSRILPVKVMLNLGKLLGRLGYYISVPRRKVANANLKAAFGSVLNAQKRNEIIKTIFENFGVNIIELFLLPRMNREYFEKYTTVRNIEYLKEALEKKKGVILLSAHYGNWEIAASIMSVKGYKMLALARQQKPYFLNKLLNKYRQMKGIKIIGKGMQLREIVKELKQNGIIGLIGDQSGRQGIEMDFFNRPVFMAEGAFRIAAATGSVILAAFNRRDGFKHEVILEKIPGEYVQVNSDIRNSVMGYRDLLEKYISAYPQQWLWINKRWKYTKTKTVLIIADKKTGHLRQAQAVAESVIKQFPGSKSIIFELSFKNSFVQALLTLLVLFWGKFLPNPLLYLRLALKRDCFEKIENIFTDIIISSGFSTRAAALLLAKENLAKTICIMKPFPFKESAYDLAIIPEHDRPKRRDNIFITQGALNLVTPEYISENVAKLRQKIEIKEGLNIGILIGGDSKYYTLDVPLLEKLLRQTKKFLEEYDARLFLSTSRRTSHAVCRYIHNVLDDYSKCVFKVFPQEENFEFALGAILGVCSAVIVSGESVSMVSEAASSGAYPIVFFPVRRRKIKYIKHDLFLENLSRAWNIRLSSVDRIYDELVMFKNNPVKLTMLEDRANLDAVIKKVFS